MGKDIRRVAVLCLWLLTTAGLTPAFAQAMRSGPTFTAVPSTAGLWSDAAFDPVHNMYLVVGGRGYNGIRGSFISASGTQLGAFNIAQPVNGVVGWWESPRICYSPDIGGFLVVYTNGWPIVAESSLWGRVVAANADGSPNFKTDQFQIESSDTVKVEQPAIAYSTTSKEFMVGYTIQTNLLWVRARRISAVTGAISAPITIAAPSEYASLAYNPTADHFLLAYRYEPSDSDIQAIRIEAGTGNVLDVTPISFNGVQTTSLLSQPEAHFDPATNRYFVIWWRSSGSWVIGRFVNADGSFPTDGGKYSLFQGYGSYDLLASVRSPVDGSYFLGFCGPTLEAYGLHLNGDASMTEQPFQVTAANPASGTFGIRVGANANQPDFLLTTDVDQKFVAAQLVTVPASTIRVSNVTPSSGPVTGGTAVTINGALFQSGATVKFGSTPAASVTFVSSTSLQATSPASGSSGTVAVTVTNPDTTTATLASGFSYTTQASHITAPANGGTLSGESVTFSWDAGIGVSGYWLSVGTGGIASEDILGRYVGSVTTYTVPNLPIDGRKIYVRLWSYIPANGGYSFADYTYNAYLPAVPLAAAAAITSPTPGSVLPGASVTVSWNTGTLVTAYWLDVGISRGDYSIYSGSMGTAQTTTVSGLPQNGGQVWMRLWSYINGAWVAGQDVAYTAASPTLAAMTSPSPNSTLSGSTVTFSWSAGTGIDAYWLDVGTVRGGYELFSKGMGKALSATVSGLPANGGTLWVRLWSYANATWRPVDYWYTAMVKGAARITSPAPGSVLPGSTVTFAWGGGGGIAKYWLDIGTAQGGYELVSADEGVRTSATVSGLPITGQPLWVRVWSYIDGAWQFVDQSFTQGQPGPAQILTPGRGSTLAPTATFTWSPGVGATAYWLDIGTAQGGYDLYSHSQGLALSATISGLPIDGQPLWVRIYSLIGGTWQFVDQPFVAATFNLTPYITTPEPGGTLTSTTTFTWHPVYAATSYWLDIGTTRGSYNIYSHSVLGTAVDVSGIPATGGTVWVRVWAYVNGQYGYIDTSFRSPQ